MNAGSMLSVGILGLVTVLVVIPLLCRRAARKRIGTRSPEFHHTHRTPVPRLGGLALAIAFAGVVLTSLSFFADSWEKCQTGLIIAGGALAMFAVGFWDDLQPLGARRKLVAQILVALGVYGLGLRIDTVSNPFTQGQIDLGSWGALATVIWLVAMTNLINLIDGIDGLAGGICLMLMGLLVYVQHSLDAFPMISCGMMGALLGFLVFNFPPAKIYLGDGGAYFLGFLIGELTITSSHKGTVAAALIAPLFVLALPILDVSLAILRRGLRGLPLFRPDRSHIHHRLLEMGLSRRTAVLGMYCFTLVFLALGFAAFGAQGRWLPVFAGAGILIVLLAAGKLSFSREWFAVGHVVGNSLRMREEIAYTIALSRWLTLEARRVQTVEEFWGLFVFSVERLGFTAVSVEVDDGKREWRRPGSHPAEELKTQYDLMASGGGLIEFRATPGQPIPPDMSRSPENPAPCIGEERAFQVISELLAEAWLKASRYLRANLEGKLAFAAELKSSSSAADANSSSPRQSIPRSASGPA